MSSPFALSFMGANYVAKELGYGAADEWGPFDVATNAAFEPIETFPARFDVFLTSITKIGFDTIDLWFAHLNWRWATPDHVAIARDSLARHGVGVVRLRRRHRRPRSAMWRPRAASRTTSTST